MREPDAPLHLHRQRPVHRFDERRAWPPRRREHLDLWDLGHLHGHRDRDERQPVPTPGSLAGGTVTFYSCTTVACASTTQLGTGTVGSNSQATFATSTPARRDRLRRGCLRRVGTNLTGSTSNVVTQTVTSGSISTTSVLTSSANPSTYGSSVTFTDTVSASSGTPGGTVTFYSCTTIGLLHQDLARDRDAQQLGQGHLRDLDASRWAPPTSRRSTGPRATTAARRRTW